MLSRTQLARLLSQGAVRRGAHVLTAKSAVAQGDEITIFLPDPTPSHMAPEDIPLDIVFEDAELVVVNKPAGMVVHPAPGSPP